MVRRTTLAWVLLVVLGAGAAVAAEKKMPREDVIDVPAIGEGLCVSNVFQTNMVLQRDKPVAVWGWAKAGEKVTVSFAGRQATATAGPDRAWQVTLEPMPANATPQRMTVKGTSAALTLENVLVGDVWLLGGQSNMEFPITNVVGGELERVSANFPQIRLLTMPQGQGFDSVRSFHRLHEWSSWSSRHFRKGDWEVCTPETVRDFSAIGTVFGRRIHMATGVPIGLIDASIGGTTVETWTPADVLRKIDGKETQDLLQDWAEKIAAWDAEKDLENRVARWEQRKKKLEAEGKTLPPHEKRPTDLRPGPVANRNRPGYCYAGVIRPLRGLAIAGALWHQGYNNCFSGSAGARMYYQVFGKMIAAWRQNFGDEGMPFAIISLCTAGEPQTRENFLQRMYDVGPYIREAQYRTFRDLRDAGDKTVGFVSSFDQRKRGYHPQIKVPVGERAAKWALATHYELLTGRGAEERGLPPTIEKAEAVDGTIRLTLSTNVTTADDSDGEMLGLAIAGEDRHFQPAEISYYTDGTRDNRNRLRYKKHMLVLRSPLVPEPVHYRYAWARNPMGNITNGRGIPLATQRSDEWILEETPVQFPTQPGMTVEEFRRWRPLRNKQMKELELDDTLRRIKEAEATLSDLKEPYEKARADWEKQKAAEAEKIRERIEAEKAAAAEAAQETEKQK
jgi:sialate O-acetylesterase